MIFDFGATTIYGYLTEEQQQGIRRIEARALKYFVKTCPTVSTPSKTKTAALLNWRTSKP